MRVQRVVMWDSQEQSWTLLGEDHSPVESVERFLSYLISGHNMERVQAAHRLRRPLGHHIVAPLRTVAGHMRELGRSGLAQQVEKLTQSGRGAVLTGPHQLTGVTVHHTQQIPLPLR
jgi:hypothetical protein